MYGVGRKMVSLVTIDPKSNYCTDELYVRFYECPYCLYDRVPFGAGGGERYPEYDAFNCPRCGTPIRWAEKDYEGR